MCPTSYHNTTQLPPSDSRMFSLEPSGSEIAPGDGDCRNGAACEIDTPPVVREWYFLDHSFPPHPAAAVAESKRFNQGPCSAWTHSSFRIERQNEVGCVGQRLLEHGGDAIGGNNIETHAGADYDSGGLRFYVAAVLPRPRTGGWSVHDASLRLAASRNVGKVKP
jgi:hypothetical protein